MWQDVSLRQIVESIWWEIQREETKPLPPPRRTALDAVADLSTKQARQLRYGCL